MSNLYSIGAMNQLGDALEIAGFSTEEVTKLKQFKNLSGIRDLVNGKAEIKFIAEPVRNWREEANVIHFSVTSDGTTGKQWIARLEAKGYRLSDYAKSLLRSEDFKPTNGVTTEIAVLKGIIFTDTDRVTKKIRAEANRRKMTKPNAEVSCLICEMFTDKEIKAMSLSWIVAMHESIEDSDGGLSLLIADRDDVGSWLSTYYDDTDNRGMLATALLLPSRKLDLLLSSFLNFVFSSWTLVYITQCYLN